MMDLKIPPVIVLMIFAGIITAVSLTFPFHGIKSIPLCVIFIAAGLIIILLGIWEFKKFKTTVNPLLPEKSNRIVDTGIYRFSRNPMYLGMLFVLAGLVFGFGNSLSWAGVIGFAVYITKFQIIPEERTLKAFFGTDYEEYLRKVRRWI